MQPQGCSDHIKSARWHEKEDSKTDEMSYVQGVQVKSGPFISSMVFIPLVIRGCNIHFLIQKGGENDAQLLKL